MQPSQTSRRWRIHALALLASLAAVSLASAAAPPPKEQPTRFTRINRDRNGNPLALQKAIVRYAPVDASKGNKGLTVDLVSVVHVGDREFYEKLNKKFKDYDVVLYEGIKGEPKNPLILLVAAGLSLVLDYDSVAKGMDLDSQMKYVDYTAKNFVHADVTWDEWGERVTKKGHTTLSITWGLTTDLVKSFRQSSKSSNTTSKDPLQQKISLAEQFEKEQGSRDMGETIEMLLIDVRNDSCIDALKKQITEGKKKIAIFYGSAHNPDFERRLVKDFGMKANDVEWVDAWDLTGKRVRDKTKRD